MANKTCKKCNQSKPLSDYYKTNTYKWELDGHDYYCKYCRTGAHLSSINNQKKKCSLDNCDTPHYAKDMCRKHYARHERNGHTKLLINKTDKTDKKDYHLRYKYGMTYVEFMQRSKNGCEICGVKPERNLHVDHDHNCCEGQKTCGKCVRGVICNRCNTAVDKMENGLMRPDYPRYKAIQQYLEAYNG